MYFDFLRNLAVAAMVFIAIYWVALLFPAYLVRVLRKTKASPIASLLSNLLAVYIVCAWPAYCVLYTRNFKDTNFVHHSWIYLPTAIAFFFIGSILGTRLVMKDAKKKDYEDEDEFRFREIAIEKLRGLFLMISAVAFLVFAIWPASARYLYVWIPFFSRY